ncbi:MAG: peptidase U32 family protein [Lachnospiraceae bacterium]
MSIFKAVIKAGADAVYVGGSAFGARAYANNFSKEELLEALDYAHIHNRQVYLTVNTLLKENELREELYDYLLPYYEQGLDAVIVQDFGVMNFIKEAFPGLSIHASTQMTVTGVDGAAFLQSQGASRVVTARELSFDEIKKIKEATGVEIESFVHGALCYCYSGQCLMSSMLGGRSGNRGRCAQPCRLPYEVLDSRKKSICKEANYILSPKDLCTASMIPELAECGIDSFKIEGRMKQAEYAAGVTSIYRKYVDRYEHYGK